MSSLPAPSHIAKRPSVSIQRRFRSVEHNTREILMLARNGTGEPAHYLGKMPIYMAGERPDLGHIHPSSAAIARRSSLWQAT